MMQRGVIVIPKSVHQERIRENIASLAVELDEADMEKIAVLDEGHRFVDGSVFEKGDYVNIFE